jgi:hypothetical protein
VNVVSYKSQQALLDAQNKKIEREEQRLAKSDQKKEKPKKRQKGDKDIEKARNEERKKLDTKLWNLFNEKTILNSEDNSIAIEECLETLRTKFDVDYKDIDEFISANKRKGAGASTTMPTVTPASEGKDNEFNDLVKCCKDMIKDKLAANLTKETKEKNRTDNILEDTDKMQKLYETKSNLESNSIIPPDVKQMMINRVNEAIDEQLKSFGI